MENEKKYCGLNHCEVGHLIAEHWNLPEAIAETIKYHHTPQDAIMEYRKMVTIIAIANIFAHVHQQEIDLEPIFFDNINLETLNLDINSIYDIFSLVKTELQNENSLEEFFD